MALILGTTYIVLAFASWSLISFVNNYWQARRIRLPILCTPIDPQNILWVLLFEGPLTPVLRKILPPPFNKWIEINSRDRNYDKIHQLHNEVGEAFIIVSPKSFRVFVAEAKLVEQLTSRRRDFVKPVEVYKILDIFGPSVVTTEGDTWSRHRKITSPPFNDRVSALVWREAHTQATDMLAGWLKRPSGINDTESDTMILALHVLTATGLGSFHKFRGGLQIPVPGYSMTYRNALSMLMTNIVICVLTAKVNLPTWMLPRKFRNIREAIDNFKRYMEEMLTKEKAAIALGKPDGNNLMSSLIRASEASKAVDKGRTAALSDDEIFGNLFSHNLAGHETTSNTLAFAISLLAAHPDWQKWIADEIDQVICSGDVDLNDYERAFPLLKRCLAVMLETLRLFGPAKAIPKKTTSTQTIMVAGESYTIPANTSVNVTLAALHTSLKYWAPDPLVWRPSRWIDSTPDPGHPGYPVETLIQMPPGSFVPWAMGPRVCTGKKFSQVEFVSVIACLLRQHLVEPVPLTPNESAGDASRRIFALVEDSNYNLLLKAKQPDQIKVRWKERIRTLH